MAWWKIHFRTFFKPTWRQIETFCQYRIPNFEPFLNCKKLRLGSLQQGTPRAPNNNNSRLIQSTRRRLCKLRYKQCDPQPQCVKDFNQKDISYRQIIPIMRQCIIFQWCIIFGLSATHTHTPIPVAPSPSPARLPSLSSVDVFFRLGDQRLSCPQHVLVLRSSAAKTCDDRVCEHWGVSGVKCVDRGGCVAGWGVEETTRKRFLPPGYLLCRTIWMGKKEGFEEWCLHAMMGQFI